MNKVAKTTKNEIASVDTNMFMADAETQSGLENVSSTDDLALPFFKSVKPTLSSVQQDK